MRCVGLSKPEEHHARLGDRRAFAVGDAATGTTVLSDLYREMRDKPAPMDLTAFVE